MEFARATSRNRSVSLTPLIDVVFLLIVFFMLSTNFIQVHAMRVQLPTPVAADTSETPPNTLTILMDIHGKLWIDRQVFSQDGLFEHIRTITQENPAQPVLIVGHEHVSVQQVVAVMDLVLLAGAANIAVADAAQLPGLDIHAFTETGTLHDTTATGEMPSPQNDRSLTP